MGTLNKWDCHYPGCGSTAVGVGGALGLRAIGWYFTPGPTLYCPLHRPDPSEVKSETCETKGPCGECRADYEADVFQAHIATVTGVNDRGHHKYEADQWAERVKNTQNT